KFYIENIGVYNDITPAGLAAGSAISYAATGWGTSTWSTGTWGFSSGSSIINLRLWSSANWGEDLIINPRGEAIYYWDATSGLSSPAVNITSLAGSSNAPTLANYIFISDISRFLFVFGCDDIAGGIGYLDPMLIRWADQESLTDWLPASTNQSGSLRLSHGSEIITSVQTRQEIFTLTDSAAYSLQYSGPPTVWGAQLLGDNISIISPNAAIFASGNVFWMGVDKFYVYDGRVQTLPCDLRRYVFSDINLVQSLQVFAGTNEGFNEVWWFYCSADSTTVDRYVVYNYVEKIWYYGTMARTAWSDSGLRDYPQAADYNGRILNQEFGVDDGAGDSVAGIDAYIESAEFDIEDGDRFMFVYRTIPDLTFTGSTDDSAPEVVFSIYPKRSSGSPAETPATGTVAATNYPVDEYTGQIYTRFRGRQAYIKVRSTKVGTTWQLGSPRMDIRPDGRATGKGV
ncbi:MAG: hypothetical protein EBS53_15510, partial [Bacteroidetes bacterium]|nr:hypothetical protein [Bacteroidota bacterium]